MIPANMLKKIESSKADMAMDKKMKVKEGSKKDEKMDGDVISALARRVNTSPVSKKHKGK